MRKVTIGLALLAVLLIAVPAMAQTETDTIEMAFVGVVNGAPGTIVPLRTEPVPEGMVGWTCTGVAVSQNNESQHTGNDFILTTGGTTAEIVNWEEIPEATTPMTGTVVLGAAIDISLRMGSSGVSSGGVVIILSCSAPTPPTTVPPTTVPPTTVPPTTVPPTTAPTTTVPGSTTTEAPPEGGVSAGGGATAGGGAEAAVLWLTGGALALLGGATVLAMRRTTGRE
jgi:hypothetical protein